MQGNDLESLSMRWKHPEKRRYYHIVLSQDLFGDWVITKAWGGLSKPNGRITHVACTSHEEASKIVHRLIKLRKSRGYELITDM